MKVKQLYKLILLVALGQFFLASSNLLATQYWVCSLRQGTSTIIAPPTPGFSLIQQGTLQMAPQTFVEVAVFRQDTPSPNMQALSSLYSDCLGFRDSQ